MPKATKIKQVDWAILEQLANSIELTAEINGLTISQYLQILFDFYERQNKPNKAHITLERLGGYSESLPARIDAKVSGNMDVIIEWLKSKNI